jgi:hypothetical protein
MTVSIGYSYIVLFNTHLIIYKSFVYVVICTTFCQTIIAYTAIGMVKKNNINNYMVINKIIFKKSKQHHTVRKIPKSNRKIIDTETK